MTAERMRVEDLNVEQVKSLIRAHYGAITGDAVTLKTSLYSVVCAATIANWCAAFNPSEHDYWAARAECTITGFF